MNRNTKQAVQFQRSEGYSFDEIAQNFGIPKSTIFDNARHVPVQKPAPTLRTFGDELTDRMAEFVFHAGLNILCGYIQNDQYFVTEENAEHDAQTLAHWNGKQSGYLCEYRKNGFTVTYFDTQADEPEALTLVFTDRP